MNIKNLESYSPNSLSQFHTIFPTQEKLLIFLPIMEKQQTLPPHFLGEQKLAYNSLA